MERLKDELLNLAFQLAYFIHQERGTAQLVTAAALESLETTTLTQDKRLYYFGQRTKISFTELHLLQRLVYEKSSPFEQEREGDPARPLSQERLLVHFIKYLVWITVQRKSLYVALGLGRVLHGYTMVETMEIYNIIIQNPARVPVEDYFRSRKKVLMDEILERFGKLLTTTRGIHGALRFATHEDPARFASLVHDCLSAFTPWQTGCYVPEHFAPTDTALPDFSFNSGDDPDEEHSVEIKRYHALLHPECFARLLRALGYAASAERLEIPRFCLANQAGNIGPDDPANGAELNPDERDELRGYLRDRERRRKTASARLLRFVANGTEVAQLDLQQTDWVRFQLPKFAEFLEIRSRDAHDDLLLATHQLFYDDHDQLQAQDAVIVLQNGQKLAFEITPSHAAAGATIAVAVVETSPGRALRLWLKRQTVPASLRGLIWQPALGFLLLAALTAGLGYLLFIKPATPKRDIGRSVSPTPAMQSSPTAAPLHSPSPQPTVATSPTSPPTGPLPLPIDKVVAENVLARSIGQPADSLTRSERETAVGLLEAHKVYLEVEGAEPLSKLISEALHVQLQMGGLFSLTTDRDAADIALKITIAPLPATDITKRIALIARIVDANGKVIWPLTPGIIARKYKGAAEEVAIKLREELSGDLKKLHR